MENKITILVVNLDNIDYTRNCLEQLLKQTISNFNIVLVDQNSSELGTKDFLDSINNDRIDVIRNVENLPLNYVWNWFSEKYKTDYLCFLNNDVELSDNFVDSIIQVFEKEPNVGLTVHTTNHPDYQKQRLELDYKIVEPFINMQGWDFSIRRDLFTKIPNYLKTYCGDDFIFNNIYEKGFDLVYILNSPMIHYEGMSKKSMKTTGVEDIISFIENKNKHYLKINLDFSKIKPTFNKIIK